LTALPPRNLDSQVIFEFTTDRSDTITKRQLLWQVLGEAPPPLVRGGLNGYVKRLDKAKRLILLTHPISHPSHLIRKGKNTSLGK
jgi:hypothetical protein